MTLSVPAGDAAERTPKRVARRRGRRKKQQRDFGTAAASKSHWGRRRTGQSGEAPKGCQYNVREINLLSPVKP
jgi:hypothetical protein